MSPVVVEWPFPTFPDFFRPSVRFPRYPLNLLLALASVEEKEGECVV